MCSHGACFKGQLATDYCLMLTSVTLQQYDQLTLDMERECQAKIQINDQDFTATFIIVDIPTHYPLFGKDWLYLLDFDVAELIGKATASVAKCVNVESLFKDFADVFKDELGLLRGIEKKIIVDPTAIYTQIPSPQTSFICFDKEGGSVIECSSVCIRINFS